MARLRHLLRNVSLLNLALLVTLIYLVKAVVLPFLSDGAAYVPPSVKKEAAAVPVEPAKAKPAEVKGPSPFDYVIIGEQNLFHPERKIPVPKVEAAPLPKPDFVLYGTMETEEFSVAYMEDKKAPRTTQGRGKRVNTVRLGDSLSGFVLKEVDADKVVMVRGDESVIVHLSDRGKVREAAGTTTPAAAGPGHQPPPKSPVTAVPPAITSPPPPQEAPVENKSVGRPVRPLRRSLFGAKP